MHTGTITGVNITGYHGAQTDVVIPSSLYGIPVIAVAERAFMDNETITGVEFPEGLSRIGHWAFGGCTGLTHVSIPSTVTDIESQTFDGCKSLAEIVIPEGVTSIGVSAFSGCSALLSLTIPGNVIEIEGSAFESCTNLESVVIEDGVERIGYDAFMDCDRLTDIFIPASVVCIENTASYGNFFFGCDNLTIHGIPGSYAEAYANEHGIPFVTMGH